VHAASCCLLTCRRACSASAQYVDETNPAKPVTIYDLGFPLGFKGSADIPGTKEGVPYLNNHLLLTIKYAPPARHAARGTPRSTRHSVHHAAAVAAAAAT
jgi:hypothetical protein